MKISLEEIVKLSKKDLIGKVVVFPTDTVYGIGSLWDDFEGINKIYSLKNRDGKKPLAVLIDDFKQIEEYIDIVNERTVELISTYWPGDVTFIFKKKDSFNYPLETIAFRIPNSSTARSILRKFGPMSTTSVNYSGEDPINNIEEISTLFNNQIDYLVTNDESFSAVSSTIVDLTTKQMKILRQGQKIIK